MSNERDTLSWILGTLAVVVTLAYLTTVFLITQNII